MSLRSNSCGRVVFMATENAKPVASMSSFWRSRVFNICDGHLRSATFHVRRGGLCLICGQRCSLHLKGQPLCCTSISQRLETSLKKIIITGANGVGKSLFASKLAKARPDVPVISIDEMKLQTNWQKRTRIEIETALARALEKDAWILEGGPGFLSQAIAQADALVWLDPPEYVRALQLAVRPWKNFGQTRPELPPGNLDWPLQQYFFALRSLKNKSKFRSCISEAFRCASGLEKWQCRNKHDRIAVVSRWSSV